jgi:hypothetical protein
VGAGGGGGERSCYLHSRRPAAAGRALTHREMRRELEMTISRAAASRSQAMELSL